MFICLASLGGLSIPSYQTASVTIMAMFVSMGSVEALFCLRSGSGTISGPWHEHAPGFWTRMTGTLVTVGVLSSFYWIFPEYSGTFYAPFYSAVSEYGVVLGLTLALLMWFECKKDPNPEDNAGYALGKAILTLRSPVISQKDFADFVLGWVIKLYFLPLMFVYFCGYIESISKAVDSNSLFWNFDKLHDLLFLVDTGFVCVGYTFSSRLIGTHLRSAEKTMLGWVVALICYQPFWSMISRWYVGSYGKNWTVALQDYHYLQPVYGALILTAIGIYVWASLSFGTRFSNLTHRGIIYAGPYKFHRHPAYVAKLTSFFLMSLPFLGASAWDSWRGMIAFGMLCGIYYLRAKTEERNLSSVGDEYQIYSRLVANNQSRLWQYIKKIA